jgi:hypothetical protein
VYHGDRREDRRGYLGEVRRVLDGRLGIPVPPRFAAHNRAVACSHPARWHTSALRPGRWRQRATAGPRTAAGQDRVAGTTPDQDHAQSGPAAGSTSDTTEWERSMPASRSVVSMLLRELGDVSPRPQGRPCGRPPAALRPGNDTTVTGEPASPSQQEDGSRHGHPTWSAGTMRFQERAKPVHDRTARRAHRWVSAPWTRGSALGSRRAGHSTTSSSPVGSARHRANIASKAGPTGVGSPLRHAATGH